MINQGSQAETPASIRKTALQFGWWAAILTSLCTLVFAAISIATPARSGPFCATWGCVPYPYTAVAQFIPGDYFWLIPGILLALLFVLLFACIHSFAHEGRKLFSRIALVFAGAYALVIIADYFSQLTIVMPSLQAGETAGLSLFTQYNPHGFFIAGRGAWLSADEPGLPLRYARILWRQGRACAALDFWAGFRPGGSSLRRPVAR